MNELLAIEAVFADARAKACLADIQAVETRMDGYHLGPRLLVWQKCVAPSLSLGLLQQFCIKLEGEKKQKSPFCNFKVVFA